ncbi:MAG: hypothetical protein P3B98_02695 [Gemmatimonadota bacterium]|nr:hypothetical protein [Gemmatimonadota bacterium]
MAQLLPGLPPHRTVVLIDTCSIIEAVRTGLWSRISGALHVETVEKCRDEALAGDTAGFGYIAVRHEDLARLSHVHAVTQAAEDRYLAHDPNAIDMDEGERMLFAHAFARIEQGDTVWILTSSDKATMRAAIRLGVHDHLRALEEIAAAVDARPRTELEYQHTTSFLGRFRAAFVLEMQRPE